MKIKERKKSNLFYYLKKILKYIYRGIFNKKTKIIFLILIIIFFFLTGTIFGLIASGYFGTIDEPSPKIIKFMHEIGFSALKDFRNRIEGIKNQNIKIPLNYIKGKLSKPEKIYIDISFNDYKKIEYKRQQALDAGVLISSAEDYVPAKIRYNNEEVKVKLRLKGDLPDHWKGDKWSFRIKVQGNNTLFGMRTFSIHEPGTRNFLNEWVYHQALKNAGLIYLRYNFIEVIINGENKGIYALEEHFNKQLIENNNKREGIIIKFNEDLMWEEYKQIASDKDLNPLNDTEWVFNLFYSSNIDTFQNKKILNDSLLFKQFEEARYLLESFRKGKLNPEKVFDTDALARLFAINTVMGSSHGSRWHNIRFYYNPITSLLEPIGWDQYCGGDAYEIMEDYFPDCLGNENNCSQKPIKTFWWESILRDEKFFRKYVLELEKVSQKSYLDELFLEIDEDIKKNIDILHKDDFLYYFSPEVYYKNQKRIISRLKPLKSLNAYFQKKVPSENRIILSVGNIDFLPLEIIDLTYNNSVIFKLNQREKILQPKAFCDPMGYQTFEFEIPTGFEWKDDFSKRLVLNYKIFGLDDIKNESVLPWAYVEEDFVEKDFIRQKPITEKNISSVGFLEIDNSTKKIFIKRGDWVLNQSVIIPAGFSVFAEEGAIIDLIDEALILSYSDLQFFGTKENPIRITSSDRTGGITVLKANKTSNLEYVFFSNLRNPSKQGWELTGAITFYESPIKFDNVKISGMNAEDSLDLVGSGYKMKNVVFEDCFSDCFDDDFGIGVIEDSSFTNCGNDCLDFSGALTKITNINIFNVGDKGISAGENSNITAENIKISGEQNKSFIGAGSKDFSILSIKNAEISNCKYGLAVYQKKPEFGPASIEAKNINMSNLNNDYIVETGSNLLIDNKIIIGSKQKVYEELYGGGYENRSI